MARLFISYNHQEAAYAFAIRHWLIEQEGWASPDIFVDAKGLHTGVDWEQKLLAEAEGAEVMLFLASNQSLDIRSFCYRELQHATGHVLAVTIQGVPFNDPRLDTALPFRAKARQVTAIDQEPAEEFSFRSPKDDSTGSVRLNRERLEGIGLTLRELGVAPNSFSWKATPAGPFPGLRPLQEGDEAIFCGRDLEIRDGLKVIEDLRATVTKRALVIQAPSGAGKSSFLRAGLWRRLRRNPGFTPLCILRTPNGLFHNPDWGLIAGLTDVFARNPALAKSLPLSPDALARRATTDLAGLLAAFADADAFEGQRRTLLLGIDQAEEMTALSPGDDEELTQLLEVIAQLPDSLDLRLLLTARDDSVDATLARLAKSGPMLKQDRVETWRLNRLPAIRFDEIITGPAAAANRAGWPLKIEPPLVEALGAAAGAGVSGESGDALPILALALQRMVAKRRAPDGSLDLAPVDAAAFLESAVTDATHDGLRAGRATADDLRQLVIPRLATWDPRAGAEGAAKRQVTSAEELFAGERARLKPLADALVDQHLLVRSQTAAGPAYEVAHEALLRVPPLGALIFACREKFEQARILEVEARDWLKAKKSTAALARSGERLRDAFLLLQDEDFGSDLRQRGGVAEYLGACRAHEERLKRQAQRTRSAVTFVLLVLSIAASAAAVYGWYQAKAALEQKQQAVAQKDEAERQRGIAVQRTKEAEEQKALAERQRMEVAQQRDAAWLQEGKAWMLRASVADERQHRYPDTLLYAAQAIGFDGLGRSGNSEEPRRFIRQDVNPEDYKAVRKWIADRPAYLPVWSSERRQDAPATALALDPAGKWLALGTRQGVRLLDVAAGTETTLPGVTGIMDLDFAPSVWQTLLSATGTDKNVHPTVPLLAIAAAEGVRLWSGEGSPRPPDAGVLEGKASSLAWSPAGDLLAGAGEDGSILLWRTDHGQGTKDNGHPPVRIAGTLAKSATSLVFSPEDAFLAAVEPGAGPRLFFPDHLAAAASWQGLARAKAEGMVELEKNEFLSRVTLAEQTTCVAVDPDGKLLAAGTADGNLVLWNAEQLTKEAEVSPEQRHRNKRVTAVAFRPDGKQLASASEDGSVKLWEVHGSTVSVVATLCGHTGAVTAVAYAPGGQLLATAGADGSAKLWDVRGEKLAEPDLFIYAAQNWYDLDPEAAWASGHGFANLTPESVPGRWKATGKRDLVAAAAAAAKEKRWRHVKLLADQGAALSPAVAAALAAALPEPTRKEFTNGIRTALVWCPPGTFTMGSPETEKDRRTNEDMHEVKLTSGFWLGKCEVTQAEWIAVMGRNPATYKGDANPVEMVSWEEVMEFCRRLTDLERARGMLQPGWVYTLPTEAQWEYACRAGTNTAWSFGDDGAKIAPSDTNLPKYGNLNDRTANYTDSDMNQDDGFQFTAPAGKFTPNAWGFYDMHGNVWEWCADWYEQSLGTSAVADPTGPAAGAARVVRGGCWVDPAALCRSAYRGWSQPGNRNGSLGFRLACSSTQEASMKKKEER